MTTACLHRVFKSSLSAGISCISLFWQDVNALFHLYINIGQKYSLSISLLLNLSPSKEWIIITIPFPPHTFLEILMNSVNAASYSFSATCLTSLSTLCVLELQLIIIIMNFLFLTFVTFCLVFIQFYCLFVLTIFMARKASLNLWGLGQFAYSTYPSTFQLLFVNIPDVSPAPLWSSFLHFDG